MGNAAGPAVAEPFFGSIKCGPVYLEKWTAFEQAFLAVREYIHWYNTKRAHRGVDCPAPLEKEKQLRNMLHKKAAQTCTGFCGNIKVINVGACPLRAFYGSPGG